MWFYQPIVSNDKLLTGTQTRTQTALGRILSRAVGPSVGLRSMIGTWGGGFITSSYLKYLKPVDVEHAHDFVASFSLRLRGTRVCPN